jgi:hypothetical protein
MEMKLGLGNDCGWGVFDLPKMTLDRWILLDGYDRVGMIGPPPWPRRGEQFPTQAQVAAWSRGGPRGRLSVGQILGWAAAAR